MSKNWRIVSSLSALLLSLVGAVLAWHGDDLPPDSVWSGEAALFATSGRNPGVKPYTSGFMCSYNFGTPTQEPYPEYDCPGDLGATCRKCKSPNNPPAYGYSTDGSSDPYSGLTPTGTSSTCSVYDEWSGHCQNYGYGYFCEDDANQNQTCPGTWPVVDTQDIIG